MKINSVQVRTQAPTSTWESYLKRFHYYTLGRLATAYTPFRKTLVAGFGMRTAEPLFNTASETWRMIRLMMPSRTLFFCSSATFRFFSVAPLSKAPDRRVQQVGSGVGSAHSGSESESGSVHTPSLADTFSLPRNHGHPVHEPEEWISRRLGFSVPLKLRLIVTQEFGIVATLTAWPPQSQNAKFFLTVAPRCLASSAPDPTLSQILERRSAGSKTIYRDNKRNELSAREGKPPILGIVFRIGFGGQLGTPTSHRVTDT
ncbi:hypothetical protein C8R43DRAFT_961920 [Mycena crocata]|nr:hypothetical protein C8R43DRAFT_961920 [Mycena crocata]